MKIKNKQLLIILPIVLLWLCALGVATVYDLDISLKIADESSFYGRFFEIAGEPPAILFASFNFSLMSAYLYKCTAKSVRDIVFSVLSVICCIGTTVYTSVETADYIAEWKGVTLAAVHEAIAVICALVISGAFLAGAFRAKENTLKKYFSTACHCAAAATATLIIIWAFKLTWGRVRFRQLDGDLSRFTSWYLPQGFTGFFSFPSGHTANATVIFSVIYYFRFLPERMKKYKPLLCVLLGIWIALVAFSRVRVGAHYLSDVLFGMAITFAIVYFARPRNLK